jgi:hypothetical protein
MRVGGQGSPGLPLFPTTRGNWKGRYRALPLVPMTGCPSVRQQNCGTWRGGGGGTPSIMSHIGTSACSEDGLTASLNTRVLIRAAVQQSALKPDSKSRSLKVSQ